MDSHNTDNKKHSAVSPRASPFDSFRRDAIVGRFKIIKELGSGGNAIVYSAREICGDEMVVALKIGRVPDPYPFPAECIAYGSLKGLRCVPKLYSIFFEQELPVMALELLGPSIQSHFKHNKNFSCATVAKMGMKIIRYLKRIHNRGIVHGDIKPSNILVGKTNPKKIYLADFGHSIEYRDKSEKHLPVQRMSTFIGTPTFASLSAHRLRSISRRDDIISLAYTMFYLLLGSLPWSGFHAPHSKRLLRIERSKEQCRREYFSTRVDERFVEFYDHAMNLKYEEKPDYGYLFSLLDEVFFDHSNTWSIVYEWERKCSIKQKTN